MGEILSFHKLVAEKNYTIQIPIIQRDYALGRESAKEIRYQFLVALKGYLTGDKSIDLDFIYGSLIQNPELILFTPLDGQQRLTTLFLLHWYLSAKENRLSEFRELILNNGKVKFSYETRITSRDFCHALVSNDITLPGNVENSLSETIKDSNWFFLSWENDPTIQSMLVVIDEIHNVFFDAKGFYDKLISKKNPIICFQFIELKNFGLTDSLYVKMNSRGKELTEFENFKAKFEQYLEKKDKEQGTKIKIEFSKKMDVDWTDLFWNYRDQSTNLFDNQLMNFIRVLSTNNYALITSNRNELEPNIRALRDRNRKINFSQYESLKCLDENCLQDIIQTLDFFKNGNNKIKTFLVEENLIDESALFESVVENLLSYTETILFFSLYKYLISNDGKTTGLYDWMRVIRNLTENTIYDESERYARCIKTINQLLPSSSNVLEFLSNLTIKLEGFAEIQIIEEQIKAILILKGKDWRKAIITAENYKYFRGQIDFLLKFSGVKEYYIENNNLDWSNELNKQFFSSFNEYSEKARYMFSESGLNELDDYLWQRALLSKGNYLLTSSRNESFLINSISERDFSWKKLLRDDSHKRDYIKLLLDEVSIKTAKTDLENIINKSTTTDWRKFFIERSEIISVCGDRKFIRWESDNSILLLERSQTNGRHREYYSFALMVRLENMGNDVIYHDSYSVDYLKYISSINGKSVQISYGPQSGWSYRFKVLDDDYLYFTTEQEVVDYLKSNKYIS